ncbi:MAG: MotA/TolQ/ExbB proton channel family protein [Candidatus Brocadiia bacterium]
MRTSRTLGGTLFFLAFFAIALAAPAFAESAASGETLSAWQIIVKGGWTMVPLGLLSLFAVGLAFHIFLILDPKALVPSDLVGSLTEHLQAGRLADAENFAARHDSVAGRIFAAGLSVRSYGSEKVAEYLNNSGRREISSLKRRITLLAYVGVISPLLGLLGTVLGMIRAFRVISMASNPVVQHEKPYLLASAIWEAMITTAAGLILAIFALLIYYYFSGRLQKVASDLEVETEKFALALSSATKTGEGR